MPDGPPTLGRRIQAVLLGLVPGLAHILVLDRPGAGAGWFVLFALGIDAAITGRWLVQETWSADLYTVGVGLAVAAWLAAFLDMARVALFRDYARRARVRSELATEGVRAYAADRLGPARKAFRTCLALDDRDPDALFWYGVVEARRGKPRRARRAWRRCLKHDLDRKWAHECEDRLARLEQDAAGA